MKKTLLSIFCLGYVLSIQAQILYGTTYSGGTDGGGAIIKFLPATNNLTASASFESFASYPRADLIQARDGRLYGMTPGGGSRGDGIIFSYDPSTLTYTKLYDFHGGDGRDPRGSLMQANDGKLYGLTNSGGSNFGGVLFSFDPVSLSYAPLYNFVNSNGSNPVGSLVQATDGKLYGMTQSGGSGGVGTIFSFDPLASTFTKLHDFDNSNGGNPSESLIQATDGKLYGMTGNGGSNDAGVIFSFDPISSSYLKLKDFDITNGRNPFGSLMQATDGKLYGMTTNGGTGSAVFPGAGVIFSFDPISLTYLKLKDFDNGMDGGNPDGHLIQASDGKLFGVTSAGGSSGVGVIFSYDLSTSTYTKRKDFNFPTGGEPFGSIMQASDGKLYGMTDAGGLRDLGNQGDVGVIFSFNPVTNAYAMLKDFSVTETGSNVSASVVQASDGKLYGTTVYGGKNFAGVIFSFDPSSSTYTKLYDFDYTNGASPYGSLIQASDGKLYGMTAYGGAGTSPGFSLGVGVIFSFDPVTLSYTKLYDFDGVNGMRPFGSLMQASDGKLYGMTQDNGVNFGGVIFSFNPLTSTYTKVYDLPEGSYPKGSLIQANDGKLYGMTNGTGGSAVGGAIFSFDPASLSYTSLYNFDGINGGRPDGSLVQASNGKLYGTAAAGGSGEVGVVFSFDPVALSYTKLHDFDGTNGGLPHGNLMQASDGKLYGTASIGGTTIDALGSTAGIIFSLDPVTSTYTKLKNFDFTNGASPYIGSTFIELRSCIATTYYRDRDGDGYGDASSSVQACSQPPGYVTNHKDCDDNNALIHGPATYYRDADGDGLGDPNNSISVCATRPPAGYVRNNYDCDDHFKPWRFEDKRVLMCHNGREECVRIIEVWIRLFEGWTLGPCSNEACGRNETVMCHNGNQDCINKKDVLRKLFEGWTLGPCFSAATSPAALDFSENPEIFSKEQLMSGGYKLSNYPNPFTRTTTIKYELPFDSKVSIKVYDVMGKLVATLVDEDKKAGSYTVDFNAGHISRGSLYYRIIATSKDKQFKQTNKMIQLQ